MYRKVRTIYLICYKLRQFTKRHSGGVFKLLRGASCHSEINSDLRKSWFLMKWILSGHTWFSGSQIFWCYTQSRWKIAKFRHVSNTQALVLHMQPVPGKEWVCAYRCVKWEQLPALDSVKLHLTHQDKYPNTLHALLSSLLSLLFCSFASFKACMYKDSCPFKLQNNWGPK